MKIKTSIIFVIVLFCCGFLFFCAQDDDDDSSSSTPTATPVTETPTPTSTPSQTPTATPTAEAIMFERSYGQGVALSVKPTSDGGYILTGGYNESTSFLIKTNNYGQESWRKSFDDTYLYGNLYSPSRHSVEETSDGGYILSVGNRVLKTNGTGDIIWRSETVINSCHIIQTSTGNYVVGWKHYIGHYGAGGWLSILDSDGNIVLEIDQCAFDVKEVSDGGYVTCGVDFHLTEGHHSIVDRIDNMGNSIFHYVEHEGIPLSVQETSDNGFIVTGMILLKLDAQGNKQWRYNIYNIIGHGGGCYSVDQTKDDGFFLVGSSLPMSAPPYYFFYDYNHSQMGYYLKTNKDGSTIWKKKIEGDFTGFYSGQQTDDGGFIIAGSKNASIVLIKTDSEGNVW